MLPQCWHWTTLNVYGCSQTAYRANTTGLLCSWQLLRCPSHQPIRFTSMLRAMSRLNKYRVEVVTYRSTHLHSRQCSRYLMLACQQCTAEPCLTCGATRGQSRRIVPLQRLGGGACIPPANITSRAHGHTSYSCPLPHPLSPPPKVHARLPAQGVGEYRAAPDLQNPKHASQAKQAKRVEPAREGEQRREGARLCSRLEQTKHITHAARLGSCAVLLQLLWHLKSSTPNSRQQPMLPAAAPSAWC